MSDRWVPNQRETIFVERAEVVICGAGIAGLSAAYHLAVRRGMRRVVFCGDGELAELAYLSLEECGLDLVGVVTHAKTRGHFLGRDVQPFSALADLDWDAVIVFSEEDRDRVVERVPDDARVILLTPGPV